MATELVQMEPEEDDYVSHIDLSGGGESGAEVITITMAITHSFYPTF